MSVESSRGFCAVPGSDVPLAGLCQPAVRCDVDSDPLRAGPGHARGQPQVLLPYPSSAQAAPGLTSSRAGLRPSTWRHGMSAGSSVRRIGG